MKELPHLRRRLIYIALGLTLILSGGTMGFVLIEGYPLFDAFYMSLITVAAVGYREIYELSFAGKVFNSFLILFGVTGLLLAVGAMTQTIIELEFSRYFELRRVRKMIEKLDRHYIVCGFARMGRGASAELHRAGEPLIVMDKSEERVERAIRAGMIAVVGDATRDEFLRDVGIARAKGLIATLATDADNLFVVLSAKGLNPGITVSSRVIEEEAEAKLRRAGADTVFAPYSVMGSRLAQAILRPHVVQFLDFAVTSQQVQVNIEQIRVSENCEFVAKSLGQTRIRSDIGMVVLTIRKHDGTMIFNPAADAEIVAGDYRIAIGEAEKSRRLERVMAETRA